MKKVLLMGMSGALTALISSSAHALNQSEAEDNYIVANGGTKTAAHQKFEAWEKLLKDELAAKRAVKIDGLGTFAPKEKTGTRQINGYGGVKTIDNYKLVKKPETTDSTAFIDKYAAETGMTKEAAKAFNDSYIQQIQTTSKQGGTVNIGGLGTFSVGKQPARSYINSKGQLIKKNAYKDPRFNLHGSAGVKQKFTEDTTFRAFVN